MFAAKYTNRLSLPARSEITKTSTCPECGGLECLCRPRFFAGQLLTEEDLNRLDHYIVEKNKLHNRHLIGWGVVCGLEVECHPCEEQIVVRQGYALSPCGDDIVVCADAVVDICKLIRQCRQESRKARDCEPYRSPGREDCQDETEVWVLSVCYDEKASRGVTALRGGSGAACCSRCSCGGSASCGCSCHDKTSALSQRPTSRQTPAQCEPTVICEGYSFSIRKYVPPKDQGGRIDPGTGLRPGLGSMVNPQGEIVQRFLSCYQELLTDVPRPPQQGAGRAEWHRYCCDVKDFLMDAIERIGSHNCLLDDALAAIRCPDPSAAGSDAEYQQLVTQTVSRMAQVLVDLVQACYVSALLPPCPPPAQDACVPLATVTVRKADCKVLRVCNLEARRFLVTMPNLAYWLSWLGIDERLRQLLTGAFCGERRREISPGVGFAARERVADYAAYTSRAPASDRVNVFRMAVARHNQPASLETLALDVLGGVDAQGKPLLTNVERLNPMHTLMANQLAIPLVESLLPEDLRTQLGGAVPSPEEAAKAAGFEAAEPAPAAEAAAAGATKAEVESLKAQLEELTKLVRQQQATINTLKKPRGKTK